MIKGLNATGNKDDVEIAIDQRFFEENSADIKNKIKAIKPSFKINFTYKSNLQNLFEFNEELHNKVKNNTKDMLEKNKIKDISTDKTYRRKIKKKLVEN